MANVIFLEQNIEILQNKSDRTKGDVWRLFELLTFLTANGEIAVDDAERYALALFRLAEDAAPS